MKMSIKTPRKGMLGALLCLLICGSVAAQGNSLAHSIDDPNLVWNPAPPAFPGCSVTFLHGNPAEPNLDFFFKIEPNTDVAKHTHKSPERMILVSGELEVTYDGEGTRTLKAGDYAYGPAGKPHSAKCLDSGPCVLFVAMEDPFDAVVVED